MGATGGDQTENQHIEVDVKRRGAGSEYKETLQACVLDSEPSLTSFLRMTLHVCIGPSFPALIRADATTNEDATSLFPTAASPDLCSNALQLRYLPPV